MARAGPASSSATPNDVNVNRKTRVAAPTIEGRASGSSTSVNRRIPVAPISAATSSKAGSSCDQNPPTTRTTTARLKKTCAANRAANEGRGPANAAPTTTVGSTNATSVATRKADRPGNRKRASRYAAGRPAASVRAVDTTACQVVNQITPRSRASPSTVPGETSPITDPTIETSG